MADSNDTTIVPNVDVVVDFLTKMHPKKPRLIVAIKPDKTGPGPALTAKTFQAEETEAMGKWIEDKNRAGLGLYFSVAPTIDPINRKAKREDIAEVTYLHVDIDADHAAGESVEDVIKTAHQAFSLMKDGLFPPTAVVHSGNGLHAYWSLTSPIRVDGDLDLAIEAAKYNQRLQKVLRGDDCHNVDRILRVPGTINWPNEKKRKLGRKPVLAKLLEYHDDRVYDITAFAKLEPERPTTPRSKRSTKEIVIPKNIERLKDINELDEWHVPDRIKQIIVHGRHPDEGPKKNDDSRSSWLFDAVCGLVRRKVPADVIFGIITDPTYKISESVLESNDPENYATRQIERATAKVVDPVLLEMNERHAVIGNHGGKCEVIEELYDETLGRSFLTTQSFDDIKKRYCNRQMQVGVGSDGTPKYKPLGQAWLGHSMRREYDKIVFAPNQNTPGAYNLWRGFAVKAVPGDWSFFKTHIRDVVCDGDERCFKYLLCWMARCVQEPHKSGQVAIVLRGEKGCGKSIFGKNFGKLFGQHYMTSANGGHVAGRFNDHLRDIVLLFGDEAFFAGDKNQERVLKALVTEDQISFEAKHRAVVQARNHIHLILASNSSWVVPAHGKERRFLVLDVSSKKLGNNAYFAGIMKQMESCGGSEAMLDELLRVDLSDFEVRDFPQTAALREQQQESARFEESAFVEALKNACTPDCERYGCQPDEVSAIGLIELAKDYGLVGSSDGRHSHGTRICQFLRKYAQLDESGKVMHSRPRVMRGERESRATLYKLRPLAELRKEFDHLVGPEGWPDGPTEWTSVAAADHF